MTEIDFEKLATRTTKEAIRAAADRALRSGAAGIGAAVAKKWLKANKAKLIAELEAEMKIRNEELLGTAVADAIQRMKISIELEDAYDGNEYR